MAGAMAGDSEETTLDVDDEVDDDRHGWPQLRPPILNWAKLLRTRTTSRKKVKAPAKVEAKNTFSSIQGRQHDDCVKLIELVLT
jgi:hypothetical protein